MLKQIFPDALHQRYGVIAPLERAQGVLEKTGYSRYFLDGASTLKTADNIDIAICNQWGIGNIGPILKIAKNQGLQIEEV